MTGINWDAVDQDEFCPDEDFDRHHVCVDGPTFGKCRHDGPHRCQCGHTWEARYREARGA